MIWASNKQRKLKEKHKKKRLEVKKKRDIQKRKTKHRETDCREKIDYVNLQEALH
jgi:hypothetical protein